jgi:GntR family transcriptional regulator/MocR family aminotransferase
VVAGLRELEAEGWIELRERSGAFVRSQVPRVRVAQASGAEQGFDVDARVKSISASGAKATDLSDGFADARLVPLEALAQAHRRGLRLKGPELLAEDDPKGLLRLREALAAHLAERRGLVAEAGQILLLRGSRAALELLARTVLGEGGAVAVETPGDPDMWEALRRAPGVELRGLPVDAEGARIDLLSEAPRLLALTPQCQFPTGAALSADRRRAVLEQARLQRFPVLELDLEFDHLESPSHPLAAEDGWRQVIYLGSLSRAMAPGLELAYLVAPSWLAERLAAVKRRLGWRNDPVLEWAVSELMVDGSFALHLRRLRKASEERRALMTEALRRELGDRVSVSEAGSGMALWMEGRGEWADPGRFSTAIDAARRAGLRLRAGEVHTLDCSALAAARVGFSHLEPEEIQQAVRLLASASGGG